MKLKVGVLRKLSVCLISAGLILSPLSVQALGFGGIKLKSALNENLNAEVSLISATENDIQSLKIKLATDEAFLRAGIARSAFLQKLDFKIKQYPNGDHYIHVTTEESVREPFLDFLLDLNWKNGRMLREYTMLLDPPGRSPKYNPAPVTTQARVAAPVVAAPIPKPIQQVIPEPEPEILDVIQTPQPTLSDVEETTPVTGIEAETTDADTAEEKRVADQIAASFAEAEAKANANANADTTPTEPFDPDSAFINDDSGELWPRIPLTDYVGEGDEADDESEASAEMGDLDYGITKANDNLWTIAEKLRNGRNDITIYQVMMALLQSNPNAFVNNNVHRLKVGQVLRIDDESALTALSKKEAAKAYIKQTKSWDNYRKRIARKASVQPIISEAIKQTETSNAEETSGELTLSSPDGESLVAGGGANEESLSNDFATVQDQLRQTKADAGNMRTQNMVLNEKLQQLEDELNRLQRSISVKDDELAALQHQLSGLGKETAEQAKKEAAVIPPEVEVKPEVIAQAKPPVEVTAKQQVQPEKMTDDSTNADPGIMDMVAGVGASIAAVIAGMMAGGSLLIIAPIVLLLLVIIAILIKRRRQGERFQESILTGATTTEDADNAMTNPSSASEESSFLDDFAMSGASAIETDDSEVDPLTEADVFMAYGRYEAAEERLNEAVKNEPERKDLQVKLLELHHATKNSDAFESSAEEFFASLDGSEEDNLLWDKVVTLGYEIAPENPLFIIKDEMEDDVAAVSDDADGVAEMSNSEVMDIGLETGVFESADIDNADDDLDFSLDTVITDNSDFDLDLETNDNATNELSDEVTTALLDTTDSDDNALDFNMDFSLDEATSEDTEKTATTDVNSGDEFNLDIETGDNSLDFNLDVADTEITKEAELDATEAADNELDFNIDASDESTELDLSATVELEETDLELDLTEADTSELTEESLTTDLGTETGDDTASDELNFDLELAGDDSATLDDDLSVLDSDNAADSVELADDELSLDLNLDASDTADDDILSGDEVGTKLDLAKAYIDMGDPEGARSILSEVLDEGSDKQKEEAQELLGQIV